MHLTCHFFDLNTFDAIYDILLNRFTTTWNLIVNPLTPRSNL